MVTLAEQDPEALIKLVLKDAYTQLYSEDGPRQCEEFLKRYPDLVGYIVAVSKGKDVEPRPDEGTLRLTLRRLNRKRFYLHGGVPTWQTDQATEALEGIVRNSTRFHAYYLGKNPRQYMGELESGSVITRVYVHDRELQAVSD